MDDEKLIVQVQERPVLYDKSLSCNKDNKKENAWQNIAKVIGGDVTGEDI